MLSWENLVTRLLNFLVFKMGINDPYTDPKAVMRLNIFQAFKTPQKKGNTLYKHKEFLLAK